MGDTQGTEGRKHPLITPLYVITLFVALTEAVIVYSIIHVTGVVQIILTVFSVVFAPAVAVAFFLILWNRPENIYSPREYGSVDPGVFITTLRKRYIHDYEYREQFEKTQSRIKDISVQYDVIREVRIKTVSLQIIKYDLSECRADILVSSDDDQISASGGVSKAIVDKAGHGVQYELSLARNQPLSQGQIVPTSGGSLHCRTILHSIVLEKKDGVLHWPDAQVVKSITQKCLDFAENTSALSIAFPVLGSGTASKNLDPVLSLKSMVETVKAWCLEKKRQNPSAIIICIYDVVAFESVDFQGLISLPPEEHANY